MPCCTALGTAVQRPMAVGFISGLGNIGEDLTEQNTWTKAPNHSEGRRWLVCELSTGQNGKRG
jgi:hypothetical protein